MGRLGFGGAAALCVLLTGTALAAPAPKCAKSDEVTAIQAAAIQQQLMVAALTCNQITSFNAFQTGYMTDLRSSDATLLKMFKRLYGARQGDAEYHSFKTRLANDSSIRSIHDNASYCQQASAEFAAALAIGHTTLTNFVSAIQVNDESPVQSCELTVALPIGGAPSKTIEASYVVPTPNPMRVAMLDTAPAAPPVAAPATLQTTGLSAPVAAAPDATAPQAAGAAMQSEPSAVQPAQTASQPAPEKKKGWLSGIF